MKNVLVFLAEGFEEIEAVTIVDLLRRADIKCKTMSITGKREVMGRRKALSAPSRKKSG